MSFEEGHKIFKIDPQIVKLLSEHSDKKNTFRPVVREFLGNLCYYWLNKFIKDSEDRIDNGKKTLQVSHVKESLENLLKRPDDEQNKLVTVLTQVAHEYTSGGNKTAGDLCFSSNKISKFSKEALENSDTILSKDAYMFVGGVLEQIVIEFCELGMQQNKKDKKHITMAMIEAGLEKDVELSLLIPK